MHPSCAPYQSFLFELKWGLVLAFISLVSLQGWAQVDNEHKRDSLQQVLHTTTDTRQRCHLLVDIAITYYDHDFDSVIYFANEALVLADLAHLEEERGMALSNIGTGNYFKGNYKVALEHYLDALKIFQTVRSDKYEADVRHHLGIFYKKHQKLDEAEEHFQEALKRYKTIGDDQGIASILNGIGMLYEERKNYEKALEYYFESMAINEKNQLIGAVAYNLNNIAATYSLMGRYEESLDYLFSALQIRRTFKDEQTISVTLNNIGEVYYDYNKPDSAIKYFQESIAMSTAINYRHLTLHTYNFLAKAYALKNEYKAALQAKRKHNALKDSIFNDRNDKQIAELMTKYETEKQEKELALVNERQAKAELDLSEAESLQWYLGLGFIALIVIGWLLHNRYRLRQKEVWAQQRLAQRSLWVNAIIEGEEKERKRMAEDLHDGLGQMLSAVKLNVANLEPAFVKLPQQEDQKAYHQTVQMIDTSIQELRSISHNMMPSVLIKLGLVPALKEFLDKHSTAERALHLEVLGLEQRLPESIEITLYRIVQELVTNSLKHAKATEINIQIMQDEDELTVLVEDDGIGFDVRQGYPKGLGINNIRSRVDFLNGEIEFDSSPGHGTTVSVYLPVANMPV